MFEYDKNVSNDRKVCCLIIGMVCPGINLKNGKVRKRQKGRFVKFICNSGFLLAGERHSTCVRGKWDPPASKCVSK